MAAYREWLTAGVDLLLGPYGSGLVRAVAPVVTGRGKILWNHGGSADDLAAPLVVTTPAPASTYLTGAVDLAQRRGLGSVLIARGRGRFASEVASGARRRAEEFGLEVHEAAPADLPATEMSPGAAVLVVGTFEEDVAAVQRIRAGPEPGLLGCVAAGLAEFGRRLGPAAEGVVAPVQWIPQSSLPEVGPDGVRFARRYRAAFAEEPSYVAAQAAATGYLAEEAARRLLQPEEVQARRTTTLLGRFALDGSWRQVGHCPTTVEWRGGRHVAL